MKENEVDDMTLARVRPLTPARTKCRHCEREVDMFEMDSQGNCGACQELLAQVMDTTDEYADWDF